MSLRLFSATALLPLLVVACSGSESGQQLAQTDAGAPVAVNDPDNVANRATQQPSGGFSPRPSSGGIAQKPDASQQAADTSATDKVALKPADDVVADDAASDKSGLCLTYFTIPG